MRWIVWRVMRCEVDSLEGDEVDSLEGDEV